MQSPLPHKPHGRRTPMRKLLNGLNATEFRRFLVTGCINTGATFLLYQVLLLMMPYWLAFTVSYCSGILFSWTVNSMYSFSVSPQLRRLLPYAAVAIANYLIGLQILTWLVEVVGLHAAISPLIVIALLVPLSFIGTRLTLLGSRDKDVQQPGRPDR